MVHLSIPPAGLAVMMSSKKHELSNMLSPPLTHVYTTSLGVKLASNSTKFVTQICPKLSGSGSLSRGLLQVGIDAHERFPAHRKP